MSLLVNVQVAMAGKSNIGEKRLEELHKDCIASARRGKAMTTALYRIRLRYHCIGQRYQERHRGATFLEFSSTGKCDKANRLTCHTPRAELSTDSAIMIAFHILLNGVFSVDSALHEPSAKIVHKAALSLMRQSHLKLTPKDVNKLTMQELLAAGDDSSDEDEDEETTGGADAAADAATSTPPLGQQAPGGAAATGMQPLGQQAAGAAAPTATQPLGQQAAGAAAP
ncbi:hypothetical protein V8C86DRAFT_3033712, partial [Haematococcus lacustris]